MTSLENSLKEILSNIEDSWSEEEKQLVEVIAEDYASLIAQKLATDEDVSAELMQVRAQASNIAAGAAGTVAQALEEGVRKFLSNLMSDFLPGF